ncbi:hypothetical protein DFQ28_008436 [Apophysomyces sp. BC1034]|nr:hypothetical protein DFQ30_004826 [Apophysomyces sp. BC1015]KAG0171817.1 hypothetical protein DFQ29_008667 [Apophysomyces sp. BC1021]KAG0186027.1 hypothetical protein DFQ28_008436 [Apophysomyces sp. BC1034]
MSSPCASRRQSSAFQWPIPPSTYTNDRPGLESPTDISVREILDKYHADPDIMKQVLAAKAAEDKKRTAKDVLLIEYARIQQRQMDLELLREQTKPLYRARPLPPQAPPGAAATASSSLVSIGYHSLAPLQQQVIARITCPGETSQTPHKALSNSRPPPSPYHYPHSAHPLCPTTTTTTTTTTGGSDYLVSPRPYYSLHAPQPKSSQLLQPPSSTQRSQQQSPISPAVLGPDGDDISRSKRNRSSFSKQNELSHDRVMEALKAKIQRGSSSTTGAHRDKHKRPRSARPPSEMDEPSSPPRLTNSNKPVLPPIDTSVGRIQHHPSASSIRNMPLPPCAGSPSSPAGTLRSPLPHRPFSTSSPSDHVLSTDRRHRRHRSSSPLPATKQKASLAQHAEYLATTTSDS